MPNNYDAIERLIFEDNLRIEAVDFHPELDVMIIILNTKAILRQNISTYKSLKKAKNSALLNYKLIAGGTGIHWPDLDVDLSLKGFLRDTLKNAVNPKETKAA